MAARAIGRESCFALSGTFQGGAVGRQGLPEGGVFAHALIPFARCIDLLFGKGAAMLLRESRSSPCPATPAAMIVRKVSLGNDRKIHGIVQRDGTGHLTLCAVAAAAILRVELREINDRVRGLPLLRPRGLSGHPIASGEQDCESHRDCPSNGQPLRAPVGTSPSSLTPSPPSCVAPQRRTSPRPTSSVAFPPWRT